ncbi:hypothetical protein J2T20_002697 [Paenibacillus wynnii]|nr:hypothetical protein [Paenibacillus wynnii]
MSMQVIAVSLGSGSAFSIPDILPYISSEHRPVSKRLKREGDLRRSIIGDIMVRMIAMDVEGNLTSHTPGTGWLELWVENAIESVSIFRRWAL